MQLSITFSDKEKKEYVSALANGKTIPTVWLQKMVL